jgi:hypothetical protein
MVQKLRNPIAQLLQNLQQLKWNIEWLFGNSEYPLQYPSNPWQLRKIGNPDFYIPPLNSKL